MKVSTVGEFTMCAGSPFQSRMVRGKNECMYDLVPVWSIWYFLLCEPLRGRVCAACKYSCLLMSIRLFVILYMIVSLCACLRFSSESMLICFLICDVMPGVFV